MIGLGNNGCGKTSLIMKLRPPGEEELRKGAGLEFTYLDVHDEERDGRNMVLSVLHYLLCY